MTESQNSTARLIKLAIQAFDRTENGSLSWAETDDPDLFLYSGSRTALMIESEANQNLYRFKVLNDRGRVVEEVSRWRGQLTGNADPWDDPNVEYEALKKLYESARRSALQVDATIEQAFQDLDAPANDEPPF